MANFCTSIEQSKKLLELGIDINTADMCWSIANPNLEVLLAFPFTDADNSYDDKIPAWSLSALLEILPSYLGEYKDGIDFGLSKSVNGKWYSAHYLKTSDEGDLSAVYVKTGDTPVDACYEMVIKLYELKML